MLQALTTTGICKPSLSWSLSCAAAQMCQTLGFNRLSRVDPCLDPMFNRKVSRTKARGLKLYWKEIETAAGRERIPNNKQFPPPSTPTIYLALAVFVADLRGKLLTQSLYVLGHAFLEHIHHGSKQFSPSRPPASNPRLRHRHTCDDNER
jgi:hypothetical protein